MRNFQRTSSSKSSPFERLGDVESKWAGYRPWLKSIGYSLRARYQPDWKASWLTSGIDEDDSEDSLVLNLLALVLDAKRDSDNLSVALKLLPTHTQELPIWQYLTSVDMLNDPRNHCVPLLAVHPLPDTDERVLAGVAFIHDHNVAHITLAPVQYHLIDFGESVKYDSYEARQFITGRVEHDLTVPDFVGGKHYDPFALDIRALGDMIHESLFKAYKGLELLEPLLLEMRDDVPAKRPSAKDALSKLHSLIEDQSVAALHQEIPPVFTTQYVAMPLFDSALYCFMFQPNLKALPSASKQIHHSKCSAQ
ncbi:hypothetical protein SISSUDRAFT_1059798 [Sistotremastrum suecicum HHB10207 ss-3]|uniref:Protein kinase domain-containing protein n=1 Tax=Sistotremastrum suecicum HHB10207 ss-3 TaxID=1314776 RepID=A0A166FWA3_9AGAM|nr:hypothetical protein SISSUDRAFT_1059798 [Sistotremastrum suecicum HHB10207 ss-3]